MKWLHDRIQNMELNFDELFKYSLFAMKINRSDPDIKRDLKWLAQFLLIHGAYTVLFLNLVNNIIYVNLKANDFTQTCKNGVLAVVYFAITGQYGIMIWKQRNLKNLIYAMKSDYIMANKLPEREQKLILEYALNGQYVCKQWLVMSLIGSTVFPVRNVLLTLWYWIVNKKLILIPLYDLVYPAFIEDRKESIFVYTLIYIAMCGYACYSGVMYCTFVPLGPIFLLHACGQLEVAKSRIEGVFASDDLEEAKQKLKNIVKQLQYIYNFVEEINTSFAVAYEMALKLTTILLPITCYEVIESLKQGNASLEFIVFIVGGTLFSSSPCYYGDLLMEKGEEVRLAIYSCGWERVYDRSIRSTIRIMLQRALRPVAIRTLFRTMCLDALTDKLCNVVLQCGADQTRNNNNFKLFQQSYTIFNLMNAAWN